MVDAIYPAIEREEKRNAMLKQIVKLTEEVAKLQQENDKLQKQMIELSKRTFYVAVIAIIISLALPLVLRF